MIQAMGTPNTTSRVTAPSVLRNSRKSRLRPPTNRMTATAIDRAGSSRGPNTCSGSIRPVTGPAITPASSNRAIPGHPVRQATHCAPIPSTPFSAIATSCCSILRSLLSHGPPSPPAPPPPFPPPLPPPPLPPPPLPPHHLPPPHLSPPLPHPPPILPLPLPPPTPPHP